MTALSLCVFFVMRAFYNDHYTSKDIDSQGPHHSLSSFSQLWKSGKTDDTYWSCAILRIGVICFSDRGPWSEINVTFSDIVFAMFSVWREASLIFFKRRVKLDLVVSVSVQFKGEDNFSLFCFFYASKCKACDVTFRSRCNFWDISIP